MGFDKYLIDFLRIDPKVFELLVLAGGTNDELLAWVKANGKAASEAEVRLFTRNLLRAKPEDDAARQGFQGRLQEVATKRAVPVSSFLTSPRGPMGLILTKDGYSRPGVAGNIRIERDMGTKTSTSRTNP